MTSSPEAANSRENWDSLWSDPNSAQYRAAHLQDVYERICQLVKKDSGVVDLGGGAGALASLLGAQVWDQSAVALNQACRLGLEVVQVDLLGDLPVLDTRVDTFVGTEILEHLEQSARDRLVEYVWKNGNHAVFSVPNDCLGPDEEPQHAVKYTAVEFKKYLERWWPGAVRVECISHYLLGICGWKKGFTMSYTTPARDEAHDIEKVLRSMRGVADEIVIGIDPRTKDNTRAIAEKYAEVVFDLVDPQGPAEERQTEVHFAWIRNQCLDRCTSDWIFMTEAHEYLESGQDLLLRLPEVIPADTPICFVLRRLGEQQWGFPWIFKRDPKIRFVRHTHNALDYPAQANAVRLPQVVVRHDRHHEQGAARFEQRKKQNRRSLYDDWMLRGNSSSLFYLASEWRDFDKHRTKELLEQFLRIEPRGPRSYQARLHLAREYALAGDSKEAREILYACVGDDWSRTEHWLWLGDLAIDGGNPHEAYRFYRYASVAIGSPPFTLWWIDLPYYSYLPAQRMAAVCVELERYGDAVAWTKRVIELLPSDASEEMKAEAERNVSLVEEMRDAGPQ